MARLAAWVPSLRGALGLRAININGPLYAMYEPCIVGRTSLAQYVADRFVGSSTSDKSALGSRYSRGLLEFDFLLCVP